MTSPLLPTSPPLPNSRVALLQSPAVSGEWPIGQAGQFLRLCDAAGLRVEVRGGWGWVPREDVLTAARLGAMRTPLAQLVGAVQPRPVERRPLLLTRRVTEGERADTELSMAPLTVLRAG